MQPPVRAGQKWRDVHAGGTAAQVITVASVDGPTVHGSYTQEDAPLSVGAGAWSISDFDTRTLISDPEWATHRVVAHVMYEDPNVDRAMLPVGWLGGRQSMVPAGEGKTVARAWWDVVAPTAEDAVERARGALQDFSKDIVDLSSIRVDNSVGARS